jgi:hypothetical protein
MIMNKHWVVGIAFVLGVAIESGAVSDDLHVLGKWMPLSESFLAINGDMEILPNRIIWEKHGLVGYRIIDKKDDALFVELQKEVDCGRYLRVGPIRTDKGGLEVAFYKTEEDLRRPKRSKYYKKDAHAR